MNAPVIPFVGTAAAMLLMDIVWLWYRGKDHEQLFQSIQGSKIDVRWFAAASIYILLPIALWLWAIQDAKTYIAAAAKGATVGFLMYAFYDLTNYATFTNWTLNMTIVDILWGTTLCTTGALAGFYLKPK
jgi:uncharacterized membrane protein